MPNRSIPCLLMRGGTSKGPYFHADDLPADESERDRLLLAAIGSPDERQIDGLGGADTLTSKVAIVSRSKRPGVDLDYLFAQVSIDDPEVDTAPSCGNMLAGVGPFAVETGLITATSDETRVTIYNVNTASRIEAILQTPNGAMTYEGETRIDGVPGTAAPILLNFMDVVGSKTGHLLPTGSPIDEIDGIRISCIDVAMPMVLMSAQDLGLSGYESVAELNADETVLRRIESIRLEAGKRMGLGDVTKKVVPKVGLLAPPKIGGDISSRYLTPWKTHAAHAVTGAVCIASALSVEGTLAHDLANENDANPRDIVIEHPSGQIDVRLEVSGHGAATDIMSAGLLRTSRLIMRGELNVPL